MNTTHRAQPHRIRRALTISVFMGLMSPLPLFSANPLFFANVAPGDDDVPSTRLGDLTVLHVVPLADFQSGATVSLGNGHHRFDDIPKYLTGRRFTRRGGYQGILRFRVEKPQQVYSAVYGDDWGGGGTPASQWRKELVTRKQLKKHGWRKAGKLVGRHTLIDGQKTSWIVFTRNCKAHEIFAIRTHKYQAPILFSAKDLKKAIPKKDGAAINGLRLTLTAEKTETTMLPDGSNAKPVKLKLAFINVSKKPIKLNAYNLTLHHLVFAATGRKPGGIRKTSIGDIAYRFLPAVAKDFPVIQPGENWSPENRVGHSFLGLVAHNEGFFAYDIRKPGVYKLRYTYDNTTRDMLPLAKSLWTGGVASNECVLIVRPAAKAKSIPKNKADQSSKTVTANGLKLTASVHRGGSSLKATGVRLPDVAIKVILENQRKTPVTIYLCNRTPVFDWVLRDSKGKRVVGSSFLNCYGSGFVSIPSGKSRSAEFSLASAVYTSFLSKAKLAPGRHTLDINGGVTVRVKGKTRPFPLAVSIKALPVDITAVDVRRIAAITKELRTRVERAKNRTSPRNDGNASGTAADVAAIKRLGGGVTIDTQNPDKPVIGVRLVGPRFDDAHLAHLKELTSLRTLDLTNVQVTDAGLTHLKRMTSLQTLYLYGTKVSDAGLKHLKGLESLKTLNLDLTQVTNAGLVKLKPLRKLETLSLFLPQVTSVGLVHLKGMTSLRVLELNGTKVTDAGLVHVKGLKRLKRLGLTYTPVTNAGLIHLEGMTSLEVLALAYTKVTDAGLEHLYALPNLRTLYLTKTKVTRLGVKALQAALPKCNIGHPLALKVQPVPRKRAGIQAVHGFRKQVVVPKTDRVYEDKTRGFRLTVPNGWPAMPVSYAVQHYRDVFLCINSYGNKALRVTNERKGNTERYNAETVARQLTPGTVYIDFAIFDGPGGGRNFKGKMDTVGRDLHSLLKKNAPKKVADGKLSQTVLSFIKNQHHWHVYAFYREPVKPEVRAKAKELLRSFRFIEK